MERLLAGDGIVAEVLRLLSDANGTAVRCRGGERPLGNGDRPVDAAGSVAVGEDRRARRTRHSTSTSSVESPTAISWYQSARSTSSGAAGEHVAAQLVQQTEVVVDDRIPVAVPSRMRVRLDIGVHTVEQSRSA
ncbi:MAG: hypothetical protein WKF58_20365 [Ilumatobacteraceae bacterium]